ncbi:hypothetical protein H2203_004040 [Taxawa tesnikishii (nom. ined.)]|nr:hypothetical protein H2203_004040 [Dothideales sp. JES 119]
MWLRYIGANRVGESVLRLLMFSDLLSMTQIPSLPMYENTIPGDCNLSTILQYFRRSDLVHTVASLKDHPQEYLQRRISVTQSWKTRRVPESLTTSRCFDTGLHCEPTILCEGRSFLVHKIILTQCEYFHKILEGQFRYNHIANYFVYLHCILSEKRYAGKSYPADALIREADKEGARVEGRRSRDIGCASRYLYKSTFTVKAKDAVNTTLFYIMVYVVADKYSVGELKEFTANRLDEQVCRASDCEEVFTKTTRLVFKPVPSHEKRLLNILLKGTLRNINVPLASADFVDLLMSSQDSTSN